MRRRGNCRAFLARSVIVSSITAAMLCVAPAAFAQENITQEVLPLAADAQPAPVSELGVETPWYEAFTLSMNEGVHPALNIETTVDWEAPGGRWGVRVGIQDSLDIRSDNSDVSAGAFINLGDRIRLGGQVRFISPDEQIFRLTTNDERQPEIKFESALRF